MFLISVQLISENPYSKYRKSFSINEAAEAEFHKSYVAMPKNKFDDTILESHRFVAHLIISKIIFNFLVLDGFSFSFTKKVAGFCFIRYSLAQFLRQ